MTENVTVRKAGKRRVGYTIPQAAKAADLSEPQLRRAVHRGEIEFFMFAGRKILTPGTVEKLKQLSIAAE
jgi:excisionase family DNA binding protein